MLPLQARLALAALALLLSCSKSSSTEGPTSPPEKSVTVFLTAEIKGTIEPCGCTSDPLGDLARTTEMIAAARRKGPVIVLDGGSTLYSETTLSDKVRVQEQLKSELIATAFADTIRVDAMALGPYDLAEGPGKVRPARQAVNVNADAATTLGLALEAPKIIEAGDIKVGVFGVVSPAAFEGSGLEVSPAAPAAREAIASLEGKGADVIIALAHMTSDEARELSKSTPGMDFVLISQTLPEPADVRPEPRQVNDTWLFHPANRGQIVSRLRLSVRGPGEFSDAIGPERAPLEIERIDKELANLKADLPKWQSDPTADPAFVSAKERELAELATQKSQLESSPVQAPSKGNYFTLAQLRISKALSCDKDVVAAKQAYDRAAGAHNLKAGQGIKPPAPPEGQAGYVGMEECESCHMEAATFWKTTRHAQAWETLEDLGKEYNFDCIACHTTGFDKPGGSNIAYTEGLQDVQCEQCHGPGSIHVDAEGPMKAASIVKSPDTSVCGQCHTPDHSDTFDFDAYLRDITGPGHGEERRKALGDGPTGRELRAAALKKAGASIGDDCPK